MFARRTWHVGWTFYLQIYTFVITEQMLKTAAPNTVQLRKESPKVQSEWHCMPHTLSTQWDEASADWHERNSPHAIINVQSGPLSFTKSNPQWWICVLNRQTRNAPLQWTNSTPLHMEETYANMQTPGKM